MSLFPLLLCPLSLRAPRSGYGRGVRAAAGGTAAFPGGGRGTRGRRGGAVPRRAVRAAARGAVSFPAFVSLGASGSAVARAAARCGGRPRAADGIGALRAAGGAALLLARGRRANGPGGSGPPPLRVPGRAPWGSGFHTARALGFVWNAECAQHLKRCRVPGLYCGLFVVSSHSRCNSRCPWPDAPCSQLWLCERGPRYFVCRACSGVVRTGRVPHGPCTIMEELHSGQGGIFWHL